MNRLDIALVLALGLGGCFWLVWHYPELRKPEELRMEYVAGHWPDGGNAVPTKE